MFWGDETKCALFFDSIFAHLDVSQSFGGHIVGPLDSGCVVIFKRDGTVGVVVEDAEVFEYVGDVLEGFGAFIHCIYFGFCGAAGGDSLSFGHPVKGTTEPYDEARDGTGFPKVKEDGRVSRFGNGSILGTPICV